MSTRGTLYRCHLFSFGGPQTDGVESRWTQELVPVGDRTLRSGELVELHVTIDEARRPLTDKPKIRFDILEQDYLLSGGLDDRVATVLGTGAPPPDEDFPRRERVTVVRTLGRGESPEQAVAVFKASRPDLFDDHILVLRPPTADPSRTIAHVVTWWIAERVEDWANAELYFIVNVDGSFEDQSDAISVSPDRYVAPVGLADLTLPEIQGVAWTVPNAHPGELATFEVDARGLQRGMHVGILISDEEGEVVADFDLPIDGRSPHVGTWTVPIDPRAHYFLRAALPGQDVPARTPLPVERKLRFQVDSPLVPGRGRSAGVQYRVLNRAGDVVAEGTTIPGRTVEVDAARQSDLVVELEGIEILGVEDLPQPPTPVLPPAIGRSFRIVELSEAKRP